ncbi:MAG: hypothetical protein KBT88_03945 [Gammaproteobacteria bacterium]|nr:hypothetical protein [Gammaproteobacteria bacterium]MBQ0838915.1 hypothetical protein [Gammaproteobacteria bacterium]
MASKQYIGGETLGLANLVLYYCLDFAAGIGQPLNPELKTSAPGFKASINAPVPRAACTPPVVRLA